VGRGFDLGCVLERAHAIGSDLTIDSQPRHSTEVVAIWEEEE
jgi:signal transduction histidine kinase